MTRVFLLLVLLAACKKPVDLQQEEARYDAYIAALPALRVVPARNPVTLKVHYVERPNLPALDTNQRDDLYRLTEDLTLKVLGYQLKIEETIVFKSSDFLKAMRPRFDVSPQRFPALSYLISYFANDRDQRVRVAVEQALARQPQERVRQYLGENAAAGNAAQFLLERLSAIFGETDFAGRAILSSANSAEEPLFSYGHWSTILQLEREADFILTNTGLIGADSGMPIYVIARGGVTSAFVENNAFRPFQGAGVIGLYPFLADSHLFTQVRGDLTAEQKLEAIAWIWVHELGHLLMKKEENYTFTDSVHRAAPDLRYYEWVKQIRDSKNHHSAQIPVLKKF